MAYTPPRRSPSTCSLDVPQTPNTSNPYLPPSRSSSRAAILPTQPTCTDSRLPFQSGPNSTRDFFDAVPNPYPSLRSPSNSPSPTRSPGAHNPPPPSSKAAWLQVLVGHLILFNSFGLIQSFGTFQPFYESLFHRSAFAISWIGSIHIFLVYFIGTFSGRLLDTGHYRTTLALGTLIQIVGLFAAGSAETYWHAFVFHGVFQGVGHGLQFCPAVANTALWFGRDRKRMLAMSLVACGGATGGCVFPSIARAGLGRLGVGWTVRVMAFVVAATSFVVVACGRPFSGTLASGRERRGSGEKRRCARERGCRGWCSKRWSDIYAVVDVRVWREKSYALYVVAMFFVFAGLWVPYFYVRDFTDKYIHIPANQSFSILLLLNAAGIPGRIIPALLSDFYLGTINTYIIVLLLSSITLFLWPTVIDTTHMYPWATAYGFCAGAVASMLQAGVASLNEEPRKLGVKIGMAFSVVGVAGLIGAPVGGGLLRLSGGGADGKYFELQIFTGTAMLAGAIILVAARVARTGWAIWRRV